MSNDNHIKPDPTSGDSSGQTENPREEARLAAMLRRIDADAPAMDSEPLRAIRERSLSAFAECAPVSPSSEAPREQETPAQAVIPITAPNIARRPMRERPIRRLALRGGAALLATAAAVLLAWSFWPTNSIGAPTFAKVIAGLRQAETLELRVIKPKESAEVWVRAPGLVRWQETPERYRISAGSRLWKIDEAANTVTTGDSPWFVNPQEQVDLLALLELGVSDAAPLLKSKPSEEREYAGRSCHVYRAVTPAADQKLLIEAFADVETGQLAGIIARRQGERASARPLAELQLVAINPTVDESRFVVAKSLTEDGRIGDVADAQGVVVLRPMLAQRWTPVCRETSLKPGDWLRTDRRGANAVRVRFSSDVELTLGPGTLVECVSPTQARLHTGEAQVALAAGVASAFDLLAPRAGSQQVAAGAKQLWRVASEENLVEVKQPPPWLGGFEGTTNNESLGSLIVHLPDGRNEPLSVGYHKVNVEIRDQIARTTIEESFVNHTNARLEGVFHFPLPQDASISGFGMWIGNELVEADVVEKQRAREIFETILRENRDPGLLEWTSGNLFKARVFPIEAHSEKRVKIVYTQVLPLRANRYRYTYGLRSDLLRTRPVRELDLTVTVQSARELRSVNCPTHSTRHEQTPHAARVEFTAQDYTPDRDFEVVCEVDGRAADVIAIPHVRGNDGYFLVQISPSAREGNLRRETLPDGQPLDLVLLCDTSASMDTEKRRQQAEFVSTVLASLSEKDRFLLCAADVEPIWASAEPQRATAENIAKAQAFLDERISLGWTDLDRAFAGVLEKAPSGAQVIYIGDGLVTTGDADPVAFVRRLQQLTAKANPPGQPRTRWLSAVTVGNTSESIVLNGIAAAGGGSVRAIGGERTPQLVALELLSEIAEPGLRELQIEFRGVQVAAVYPERLPNVAAGAQQIVVGRYLPGVYPQPGQHQQGEIIVSGLLGNEPVRYTAKLDLVEAEAGNSFIPRLWARGHLDHLLRQGNSPTIREEIIRLSEEFHIITPYTSLLVLETDADRERFGVQRRFEMRDGERFFAEGKADATFALRQAQSKRAGDWRLGLRRQALAELAALGRTIPRRNPSANRNSVWDLQKNAWYAKDRININALYDSNLWGETSAGSIRPFTNYLSLAIDGVDPRSKSLGDLDNQTFFDSYEGQKSPRELAYTIAKPIWETDGDGDDALIFDLPDIEQSQTQTGRLMLGVGLNSNSGLVGFAMSGEKAIGRFSVPGGVNEDYDPVDFQNMALSLQMSSFETSDRIQPRIIIQEQEEFDLTGRDFPGQQGQGMGMGQGMRGMGGGAGASWGAGGFGAYPAQNGTGWGWDVTVGLSAPGVFSADLDVPFTDGTIDYAERGMFEFESFTFGWPKLRTRIDRARSGDWLNAIAPALSPLAGRETPPKDPLRWSAEALALAKSLLRTESLARMNGGIELRRTVTSIDPVWNRRATRPAELVLYSPGAWVTRSLDASQECVVNFCDIHDRGVYSRTTSLGRVRRAFRRDLLSPPLSISDDSLHSLAVAYAAYVARVVPGVAGQASLILTDKESGQEVRLLIDVERHVVLRRETFADGRSQGAITSSDFVEIAGSWWARRQTRTDERDRVVYETTLELKPLAPEPFAARLKEELASRAQAYLVRLPLVRLDVARQHQANGAADFDDDLRLLLEACRIQQWDEALAVFDSIEKLSADRPGVRWMRTALLRAMRRNEEARQRLLADARALAASPAFDDIPRATLILRQLDEVASPAEQLEFVELLKPVFDRQSAEWDMTNQWRREALNIYRQLDREEKVTEILLAQAKEDPSDTQAQVAYANQLAEHGDFDAAYAWLQTELDRPVSRESWSDSQFREAYAALLKRQGRWADWLRFSTAWIERKPVEGSPYSEHLTSLVYNDRIAEADRLAEAWLAETHTEGPLTVDCRARLAAAVSYALGEGNWRRWPAERAERWAGPLAEAAKHLVNAKNRTDFRFTQNIVQDPFTRSEACERLRGYALTRLQDDVATLSPAQISLLLQWATQGQIMLATPLTGRTQFSAGEIPDELWQGIAAKLRERWRQTADIDDRRHLGEALRTIYGSHFGSEALPFYREQLAAANDDEKPRYLNELYQALFNHQWSEAIESEAFELLPRLNAQLPPIDRLAADTQALASLFERMLAGRQTIAEQTLQDQGKTNELTGAELQAKRAAAILASRQALAARLRDMAAKEQGALRPWLQIEWTLLQMQMGENRAEVAEICWQILGEAPRSSAPEIKDLATRLEPKPVAGKAAEEPDWEPLRHALQTRSLENQLRRRALTTVMNLAARRDAAPADVARRVSRYIDAGVALDASESQAWRAVKFQWLIVLDKPDELERQLHEWIRDDSLSRWRKPLALLLAERGRLDEAVQLFEAAQKDNLLTAVDYNTLANWYLAQDQRAEHDRVRLEAIARMPERAVAQRLNGARNRWNPQFENRPSELDEETLLACRVLFKKSANPEAYLGDLGSLYQASHDFRLLEMLPDALLGRSSQQIYGLLESLRSTVIDKIQHEATVDEIVAHIVRLREQKLTAVDQRSLDLFEALIEARASELANQPGPRSAACLAAMRRAFEREWSEGESPQMVAFLYNLGRLATEELSAEQMREIRALRDKAKPGSSEHLEMTANLATLLFDSYHQYQSAIDELEAAIRSYSQANQPVWGRNDSQWLTKYVDMLADRGHFRAAEDFLQARLRLAVIGQQRSQIESALWDVYHQCLKSGGAVSLGSGEALFRNLLSNAQTDLAAANNESTRQSLISQTAATLAIALDMKLPSAPAQARNFAFEVVPQVLVRQHSYYSNLLHAGLYVLDKLHDDALSLDFIVSRMEQFPLRVTLSGDRAWQMLGDQLNNHRHRARDQKTLTPELDARAFKLALAELKQRLLTSDSSHHQFTRYGNAWGDKAGELERAALQVYEERPQSLSRVISVTHYLHHDLHALAKAIEILFLAERDKVLDSAGRERLVNYLQLAERYAESIPLLEGVIERDPDAIAYRTQLLVAYHRAKRPQQMQESLAAIEKHFHTDGRWNEQNIVTLADACNECELIEQAAGYWDEAISLHQRARPRAAGRDEALSGLYKKLARARSELGQTKSAIDAALAAVVSSGAGFEQQADARSVLDEVLSQAKDLDAFLAQWDEETAKSGQDSPLLRKAIGQCLQERGDYTRAIQQWRHAARLQPEDKQTHEALIECYDNSKQPDGAMKELLALANIDLRDATIYERLMSRMQDNAAEAERAATSIVEAAPSEAETHASLAKIREKQTRWDEAIVQWEQVARLRALEPTGLLGLANAQIRGKHFDAARETLNKLRATKWPERFNTVEKERTNLEQQLPK